MTVELEKNIHRKEKQNRNRRTAKYFEVAHCLNLLELCCSSNPA